MRFWSLWLSWLIPCSASASAMARSSALWLSWLTLGLSTSASQVMVEPPEAALAVHWRGGGGDGRLWLLLPRCPARGDSVQLFAPPSPQLRHQPRLPLQKLFHSGPPAPPPLCGVKVKLLAKSVPFHRPVLRVLALRSEELRPADEDSVCVRLFVVRDGKAISAQCRLKDTCLLSLLLPLVWWRSSGDASKPLPLRLEYQLSSDCSTSAFPEQSSPFDFLGGGDLRRIDEAPELVPASQEDMSLAELSEAASLLLPRGQLGPGEVVSLPLRLSHHPLHSGPPLHAFSFSLTLPGHARLLALETELPEKTAWQLDGNVTETSARVDAVLPQSARSKLSHSTTVLVALVHVAVGAPNGKLPVDWAWERVRTGEGEAERAEGQAALDVAEAGGVSIVPALQEDALLNTGALSGSGVGLGMRVWRVAASGAVADVTLLANCSARTPHVLKVTPSCTSVFVDGSESRGSSAALVDVSLGRVGLEVPVAVWYPELPVELALGDPVLERVARWSVATQKTIDLSARRTGRRRRGLGGLRRRSKRALAQQLSCEPRFQETSVRVLASFRLDDERTGKRSYAGGLGRDLLLDVTALTASKLRVANGSVAQLFRPQHHSPLLIRGSAPGSTELRLPSPFHPTLILGSTQLHVSEDFVTASALHATPVTSMELVAAAGKSSAAQPHAHPLQHPADPSRLVGAKLAVERELRRKFQEGWVSLEVEYSDGQRSEAWEIGEERLALDAWSRDESVVEVDTGFPAVPRLIAVGDGATLVDLELKAPMACQPPADTQPLLAASLYIHTLLPSKPAPLVEAQSPEPATSSSIAPPEPFTEPAEALGQDWGVLVIVGVGVVCSVGLALHCLVLRSGGMRGGGRRGLPGIFTGFWGGSKDAPCQEWVWLSPEQVGQGSVAGGSEGRQSREEQRRRLNAARRRSYGECGCGGGGRRTASPEEELILGPQPSVSSTNSSSLHRPHSAVSSNRVSYQGSEISIHFAPEMAGMEVHPSSGRQCGSWHSSRQGGPLKAAPQTRPSLGEAGQERFRILANPLPDSSSEQNLSDVGWSQPPNQALFANFHALRESNA